MPESDDLNESMKFPKFYLKKPKNDPHKFKRQNYQGFLAEQRIGRNFMKDVGRTTSNLSQFQNTSYEINYKQIDKHVRLVKIQNINERNVAQSNIQRYNFRVQPKCYFSCNNQLEKQESTKIRGFEFQKQTSRSSYVRKPSSFLNTNKIGDETDILAMEIKNFLIKREKNRLPDHIVFHTDDSSNDPFAKFDQMKQKMLMNNNSDVIKKPKKNLNHRPGTRNQQNSKSPKKN